MVKIDFGGSEQTVAQRLSLRTLKELYGLPLKIMDCIALTKKREKVKITYLILAIPTQYQATNLIKNNLTLLWLILLAIFGLAPLMG